MPQCIIATRANCRVYNLLWSHSEWLMAEFLSSLFIRLVWSEFDWSREGSRQLLEFLLFAEFRRRACSKCRGYRFYWILLWRVAVSICVRGSCVFTRVIEFMTSTKCCKSNKRWYSVFMVRHFVVVGKSNKRWYSAFVVRHIFAKNNKSLYRAFVVRGIFQQKNNNKRWYRAFAVRNML